MKDINSLGLLAPLYESSEECTYMQKENTQRLTDRNIPDLGDMRTTVKREIPQAKEAKSYSACDVNDDGSVDIWDAWHVFYYPIDSIEHMMQPKEHSLLDISLKFLSNITLAIDLNKDGRVDTEDLKIALHDGLNSMADKLGERLGILPDLASDSHQKHEQNLKEGLSVVSQAIVSIPKDPKSTKQELSVLQEAYTISDAVADLKEDAVDALIYRTESFRKDLMALAVKYKIPELLMAGTAVIMNIVLTLVEKSNFPPAQHALQYAIDFMAGKE